MYKKIVRKDGCVIILLPRQDARSVTFEVMFKVGSRQEHKTINGSSHFIEHLMFKGTKRRPNTMILTKELDAVGAEYNAFTGKDHTSYYIHTDANNVTLAIDMIGDMLHNSKFESKEVERERGVIVEELNMYQDNPAMHIDEVFEASIYKGNPLGWEIGGPREVIRKVSRKELVDFRDKYYYRGNMVIGLTGNFDEQRALALINSNFPLKAKKAKARIRPISMKQAIPRVKIAHKEVEQVQMMLGFPAFKRNHKDSNALLLLAVIMGGTMSSRLFINIRERKGLAYDIRAMSEAYEDTGYFAVRSGLDKSRIYEAIEAIQNELNRVKATGVTAEELKRAKNNIRGRLVLKFEKPNNYLSYLISQELLTSTIYDLEQKLARINTVTRADIHRVAKQVISWKKSNLALIGPFLDGRDSKKFLSMLN